MGSLFPSQLSLNCRFSPKPCVQKTIGGFLAEVSRIRTGPEKIHKLDDYVNRLEDEMKKIDAFKRELPLCMLLLRDAIAMMKEERAQCNQKSNSEPVLEEFIPLKKSCSDEKDDDKIEGRKGKDISSTDKMNWMSSVQLWNPNSHQSNPDSDFSKNELTLKLDNSKKRKEEEINQPGMDNLLRSGKIRTVGMTFLPLKGSANFPVMTVGKEDRDALPVPGLSLCTPEIKNSIETVNPIGFIPKPSCSRSGSSSATNVQSNFKVGGQQSSRKQRRCWSPELHRQFVHALQSLGGAQVATPKQIRELMQVDGLTNDEVKSHLQKFRLHTRKANKSAGLRISQDQSYESSKQNISQSGSPEGPLGFAGSSRADSGCYSTEYEDEKSECP